MNDNLIRSYRDLLVWQKGMDASVKLYGATKSFPKEEMFGLTQQLRRASVSVPSNIAEGYGRATPADYAHFLRIARGSLFELQTQLELALRLNYLTPETHSPLNCITLEIELMLNSLIAKIESYR